MVIIIIKKDQHINTKGISGIEKRRKRKRGEQIYERNCVITWMRLRQRLIYLYQSILDM